MCLRPKGLIVAQAILVLCLSRQRGTGWCCPSEAAGTVSKRIDRTMQHTSEANRPFVFIIDDSVTDCLLMSKALQEAGYQVQSATDSHEGLRTVLTHPPQCLILDIILPGVNGYAICRQIRAMDP